MADLQPREHGDSQPQHHPSENRGNHGIAGFVPVVDEAARAALALTCTDDDRNRVVEQTAGVTPGLYVWNGSAFVALGGADAALAAAAAAQATADAAASAAATAQSTATAAGTAAATAQGTATAAGSAAAAAASAAATAQSTANAAGSAASAAGSAAAAAQSTANGAAAAAAALQANEYDGARRLDLLIPETLTLAPTVVQSIPGPASGYLRVIVQMKAWSVSTAGSLTAILKSGGTDYYLRRTLNIVAGGIQTVLNQVIAPPPTSLLLGFGETLNVHSNGQPVQLTYLYRDIPVGNISLVRLQLSTTPPAALVEAIPVAEAGFFRRVLHTDFLGMPSASYINNNDDSASATVEAYIGATLYWRENALATVASNAGVDWVKYAVTTQALNLSLRAGVASRPVTVVFAYETLPVPA